MLFVAILSRYNIIMKYLSGHLKAECSIFARNMVLGFSAVGDCIWCRNQSRGEQLLKDVRNGKTLQHGEFLKKLFANSLFVLSFL